MPQPILCPIMSERRAVEPSSVVTLKGVPQQGTLDAVPCLGIRCAIWLGDERNGGCTLTVIGASLNAIATGLAPFIEIALKSKVAPSEDKIN